MHPRSIALGFAAAIAVAAPLGAQAFHYPAMQLPQVGSEVAGVVAGGSGTTIVGQFRGGSGRSLGFSADLGITDFNGGNAFLVGGGLTSQLARANASVPLDFAFTAGIYAAFHDFENGRDNGLLRGDGGGYTAVRVPLGVVLGRRLPLDGGVSITPFAHPRVAIDFCGDSCGDDTDVDVLFDLGADVAFSPALSLRFAAAINGGRYADDSFGLGLVFRPAGGRGRR